MTRPTAGALLTLLLLGAYHLMRQAAARCVGGGCEVYIPLSLLLPLLCWIAATLSGMFASAEARGSGRFLWLAGLTALALIGPVVSLALLRDSPDLFVLVGSLLIASAPVAALSRHIGTHR